MVPGGQVHAGTINLNGALTVEVTAPFAESSIARVLEMVENAAARKASATPPLTCSSSATSFYGRCSA